MYQYFTFSFAVMKSDSNIIRVSGINPFDRAKCFLQYKLENEILKLISATLRSNISTIETPLVTDISLYNTNPDNWVLEQIVNGTAEISSTTLILSPDSPTSVYYSHEIETFRPQLYYKAKSLREKTNIYLAPFSTNLWICLISAVFLLTLTLIFILSREEKLPHKISYDVFARLLDIKEDRDENWADVQDTTEESLIQKEKWEMGEILLVCLGAICQQGSARDPSTNAARLLLLVLFILTVMGYTAYSASIISLISLFPSTEHEETHHINHFSKDFKTLLHNTNNIHRYFNVSFEEIEFCDPRKGFEKTIKGEAAFVGDRDVSLSFFNNQKYASDVRCTLSRVYLGVQYHKVFAIKIGSKYKEKINTNILRLKQSGLIDRERKRFYNVQSPCTSRERSSKTIFISFNGEDVKPILKLFQFGLVTSLVLLFFEILIYYCPKEIQKFIFKSKTIRFKKQIHKINTNSSNNAILQIKKSKKVTKTNVLGKAEILPDKESPYFFLL